MFPAYQGEREFDDDQIEPLSASPQFVAACGFATAKAPGHESDGFLATAMAANTIVRCLSPWPPQAKYRNRLR